MLKNELIKLTAEIKSHLTKIKINLDMHDEVFKNDIVRQEEYLKEIQEKYSLLLDKSFEDSWSIIKTLNNVEYKEFKTHSFSELSPLLLFAEINNYIYNKPLGYPGDFRMMNYIYDYGDKYLGKSSYEKFVNYYTCRVPICRCNRNRKEYLKENILKVILDNEHKKVVKMTSIASGAAREMLELLASGKIDRDVELTLYDFERKIEDYINLEYKKIPKKLKDKLKINYIFKDIKELILKNTVDDQLNGQDFIYSIGIFDYLPERVAIKMCKKIFGLLNEGGKMMLCNASENNASHRAYYEVLGDWNMIYRNEDDFIRWGDSIGSHSRKNFGEPDSLKRYLYYFVSK